MGCRCPESPHVAARTKIEAGSYVDAADRLEKFRPGYAVVKMQRQQRRTAVAVKAARVSDDRRSIVIESEPRTNAVNYAISISGESPLDVVHDLSGVDAWLGTANRGSNGMVNACLPHADFAAALEFTRRSAQRYDIGKRDDRPAEPQDLHGNHDAFWKEVATGGDLRLSGQLDLWQMLTPATQPISKLDYTPEPETVTVVFKRVVPSLPDGIHPPAKLRSEPGPQAPFLADDDFYVAAPGAKLERVSENEARLIVTTPKENHWQPFELAANLPVKALDVSYFTNRDPRPRALPTRRILLPFATSATIQERVSSIPEIAGGNWETGRALFGGKATCATCHQLRGAGVAVGPDLGNLIHRDYASVLKDIAEPSAAINPDAVGYVVTMNDGRLVTGTRLAETGAKLHIAQTGGAVAKLKKSDISKTEPMTVSLMPAGLHKALTPDELRDLMTYLLLAAPPPAK